MTPQETNISSKFCVCRKPSCQTGYGRCHCGCGGYTNVAPKTISLHGVLRGVPNQFIVGHSKVAVTRPEYAKPFKINGVYCRLIPLTKGYWTIVWDSDYEWLMRWKWYAAKSKGGNIYACRAIRVDGKVQKIYMQNLIFNPPPRKITDHVSGTSLDNRRDNFREASRPENAWNSKIKSDNTSGYRGVSFFARMSKWKAQINASGKRHHLGYFDTPELAYAAYCAGAKRYHGEFSRIS